MKTTPDRTAAPSKPARSKGPASAPKRLHPATDPVDHDEARKREVMIRLAAYTFYERRGYVSGNELEDWLEAEVEVDRQAAAAPKPAPKTGGEPR